MNRLVLATGGVVSVATAGVARRYRREMAGAAASLRRVDRQSVATPWGAVEYAEQGTGAPVLVLHGIYGGCDTGLLGAQDLVDEHRVVAVSRFGYLGSSLPPGATSADQADALASVIDALDLGATEVIGISAGATSAIQLALRHPDKVRHLAILVGNVPGSPTAIVQPAWVRLMHRQLPIWLLKTFLPHVMARLAGVPRGYPMSDADARFVNEFLDGMFPLTPRRPGVLFDAFVSNADVAGCHLEAIRVPTLLVHTKDDVLASHDAAKDAAARIPGARFVSLEQGGHLMLGQEKVVHDELAVFFADRADGSPTETR